MVVTSSATMSLRGSEKCKSEMRKRYSHMGFICDEDEGAVESHGESFTSAGEVNNMWNAFPRPKL